MTALLPPPADQRQIAILQHDVKRRARLTVAWATIIASVIGAGTMILTTCWQRGTREEVERLERNLEKQTATLERLSGKVDDTAQRVAALQSAGRSQATPPKDPAQGKTAEAVSGDNGATVPLQTGSAPSEMQSRTYSAGSFTLHFHACQRSVTTVTCSFTISNAEQERELWLRIYGYGDGSRAIDEDGNEYWPAEGAMGSFVSTPGGSSPRAKIPSGAKIKGWLKFRNIPENVTRFHPLQITLEAGETIKVNVPRVQIAA